MVLESKNKLFDSKKLSSILNFLNKENISFELYKNDKEYIFSLYNKSHYNKTFKLGKNFKKSKEYKKSGEPHTLEDNYFHSNNHFSNVRGPFSLLEYDKSSTNYFIKLGYIIYAHTSYANNKNNNILNIRFNKIKNEQCIDTSLVETDECFNGSRPYENFIFTSLDDIKDLKIKETVTLKNGDIESINRTGDQKVFLESLYIFDKEKVNNSIINFKSKNDCYFKESIEDLESIKKIPFNNETKGMISSYKKDFNNYFKESDLTFSQLKLKTETPIIVKIDKNEEIVNFNFYNEEDQKYEIFNYDASSKLKNVADKSHNFMDLFSDSNFKLISDVSKLNSNNIINEYNKIINEDNANVLHKGTSDFNVNINKNKIIGLSNELDNLTNDEILLMKKIIFLLLNNNEIVYDDLNDLND